MSGSCREPDDPVWYRNRTGIMPVGYRVVRSRYRSPVGYHVGNPPVSRTVPCRDCVGNRMTRCGTGTGPVSCRSSTGWSGHGAAPGRHHVGNPPAGRMVPCRDCVGNRMTRCGTETGSVSCRSSTGGPILSQN